jgi:hypothetical protein
VERGSEEEKLGEGDLIKQQIARLEKESRRIKEENRRMKLENTQLVIEHRMMQEEKRLLGERKDLDAEDESESDIFCEYFLLTDDERIFLQSKGLLQKIAWTNSFLKISTNDRFLVLMVPAGKQDPDDPFVLSSLSRTPSEIQSKRTPSNLLDKLSDNIIFNHVVPFLSIPELQSMLTLDKTSNLRFTPILKSCLLKKLENSIVYNKFAKQVFHDTDHQQQLTAYILKLQNYCYQFFLKLSLKTTRSLADDSKLGKDIQQFVICVLKFFFGEQLKLGKLTSYTFFDWNAYFRLFRLLTNHVKREPEKIKCPDYIFDLANFPDKHAQLRTILIPEAFRPETSKKIQVYRRIGNPSEVSEPVEFRKYCDFFVTCTEFDLDLNQREDPLELITPLFLRALVKTLQVLECMKFKFNFIQECLLFSKEKLFTIPNDQIPSNLFQNFVTQFVNKRFDMGNQYENVDALQGKLKDVSLHTLTILEHLKKNSMNDFFCVDVFLNFPRELLEKDSTRKVVVDSSLSVVQAIHTMKKVDRRVDFQLFYELIHTKIFELIQRNNREIRRNEEIKKENKLKIREIEQKINQNQQIIHGTLN